MSMPTETSKTVTLRIARYNPEKGDKKPHFEEYELANVGGMDRVLDLLIRVKGALMPGPEGKPELTEEQALAKAPDLRKKLVAGADFATVAKAKSGDTGRRDRKSTRLNSSHTVISYAGFCLKKKKKDTSEGHLSKGLPAGQSAESADDR